MARVIEFNKMTKHIMGTAKWTAELRDETPVTVYKLDTSDMHELRRVWVLYESYMQCLGIHDKIMFEDLREIALDFDFYAAEANGELISFIQAQELGPLDEHHQNHYKVNSGYTVPAYGNRGAYELLATFIIISAKEALFYAPIFSIFAEKLMGIYSNIATVGEMGIRINKVGETVEVFLEKKGKTDELLFNWLNKTYKLEH